MTSVHIRWRFGRRISYPGVEEGEEKFQFKWKLNASHLSRMGGGTQGSSPKESPVMGNSGGTLNLEIFLVKKRLISKNPVFGLTGRGLMGEYGETGRPRGIQKEIRTFTHPTSRGVTRK